jgi:hypothetical protein
MLKKIIKKVIAIPLVMFYIFVPSQCFKLNRKLTKIIDKLCGQKDDIL